MKSKTITQETKYVKQVDVLSIEGKNLRVFTTMYEREKVKDEWWESCASSTLLPLKEVRELLND